MYDYVGQNGLPPHMAPYGLAPAASPRPGSAYGQPAYDESFHMDGEIFDPEVDPEYYIPDQNLIQEWPFGHKPGLEGKSTITYSPQQQVRAMNPQNAGMFANALRGPAIQYGAGYPVMPQPPQPPQAQLPGPGFFSQNNQQAQGAGMATQAGVISGSIASLARPGITPTASPATLPPGIVNPKVGTTMQTSTPKQVAPMMPPNAVIPTQSSEARPKLIPGSVGVPASTVSPIVSKAIPQSTITSPMPGSHGGTPQPGSASSILSTLASKHQEEASKGTSQASLAASTAQKTVIQGLTFSTTPQISQDSRQTEQKVPVAATTTTPAAKPFGGFSFTTPTKPGTPGGLTTLSAQSGHSPAGHPAMPFGQQPGAPSFAALASNAKPSPGFHQAFHQAGDQKSFVGTGTPLFGKSPSPRRRNTSAGSDDHVEEYEPNVDFKPVIQLPDLVEVKTGEEEEERLFCERAKLFRFDNEANQWKERGLGEMKILRHRETRRVRILMRREQVLKLCANHTLSTEMKLTQMESSDKAWVWNALDFSDGEMKQEKMAIKFKTSDIAEKFRKAFEDSQAEMETEKKDASPVKKECGDVKSKSGPLDSDKCSLAEMFKPKAGSWMCDGCFVSNGGDVLKCPCCQTLKPGVKPEDIKSTPAPAGVSFGGQPTGQSGFKFGDSGSTNSTALSKPQTGSGFQFGAQSKTPASPATSGFKFGTPTTTASVTTTQKADSTTPAGGFKFGTPVTVQSTSTATTTAASGFMFGSSATTATSSPSTGFKFGSPAVTTTSATAVVSSTGGLFGNANQSAKGLFGTPTVAPTTTTPGLIFGQKPAAVPFGSTTSSPAASSPSLFGTPTAPSGLFGSKPETETKASTGGYVFGGTKTEEKTAPDTSKVEEVKPTETKDTEECDSLLARYLSSPDSWKCIKCSTNNDGLSEKCKTCGADQKTCTKEPEDIGYKFGQSTVKPVTGTTATPAPFKFGETESAASGFSFASPKTPPSEGFKFNFAPDAEAKSPQPAASLGSGFHFSMSMTPMKSPQKSPGKVAPEINEEGYYVNKDGDDSHIHFEPVIALPDQVDVKTGEEDEEVVFSHRAKLYRFGNGEWKERGLGDVKVLYNAASNKARILMRREQIFKPCCNHYVTPELKFQPMPNSEGCALVWFAMDFADEEPKTEQFSIKFRSEAVAKSFENAVEDAKGRLTGGARPKVPAAATGANIPKVVETFGAKEMSVYANGDVEIVSVEEATPAEIAMARKLQLPDHFFMYTRKPACLGCIGCLDEFPQVRTTGTFSYL